MLSTNLFSDLKPRILFTLVFILCLIAFSTAIYSQYFMGAEPCPLCIAQRIIYVFVGLVALAAAIHNPLKTGIKIYSILMFAVSAFGIKTAYHHVWLQSLPPSEWPASCGMPLEILYKKIPLTGFIHTILSGSAECAMITWRVFGISGPILSLTGFIVSTLIAVIIFIKTIRQV